LNNYSPGSEDQPRKHEEMPCASNACKEKNAREDKNDVENKESGEKHFAEELHLWNLVIVDIVSPDPLTSDELSDVVAVVVQEDGHGGEEGRPDDDPHRAQDERSCPR